MTPAMKKLVKLISKWKPRLFLTEWAIHLKIAEQDLPSEDGTITLAVVNADPVYLNAVVTVFPAWTKLDAESQEDAIVHELNHCLIQEVYDAAAKLFEGGVVTKDDMHERIERLTQRVTNVALMGWRTKK